MTFRSIHSRVIFLALLLAVPCEAQDNAAQAAPALPYRIVDTGQRAIFSNVGQLLKAPKPGEAFYGQDGFYQSAPLSYVLNNDGLTVYDKNTGLTWQRSPDTNGDGRLTIADKLTWKQAQPRPPRSMPPSSADLMTGVCRRSRNCTR